MGRSIKTFFVVTSQPSSSVPLLRNSSSNIYYQKNIREKLELN
jgi:hypothetical protein